MSESTRMPLWDATQIGLEIIKLIDPYCERTEFAGSIRRALPFVGDIEIICSPLFRVQFDIFGKAFYTSQLDTLYWTGIGRTIKSGPRYKQFMLVEEIKLDLFVVLPPVQWGVLFAIRTGPSSFSRWIVTQRSKGGCLPSNCRVKNGGVYLHDQLIPMPKEIDFLDFLGLGWIEPVNREDYPNDRNHTPDHADRRGNHRSGDHKCNQLPQNQKPEPNQSLH